MNPDEQQNWKRSRNEVFNGFCLETAASVDFKHMDIHYSRLHCHNFIRIREPSVPQIVRIRPTSKNIRTVLQSLLGKYDKTLIRRLIYVYVDIRNMHDLILSSPRRRIRPHESRTPTIGVWQRYAQKRNYHCVDGLTKRGFTMITHLLSTMFC